MIQNNYGYESQRGVPGGLVDSSPRSIISRANGEATPVKFGYGVVCGGKPGVDVKLPVATSEADSFEGIVMADIAERDINGAVANNPTRMLGILEWGKAWVRVADSLTIAYGQQVYLITKGDDVGKFTNDDDGGDNLAINGRFIGAVDSGDIAPVKLYNAPCAEE